MLSLLAKNIRIKRKTSVYIDNLIFRLHYRLTFWFLLTCTALVCARQYIGEHINCIADAQLKNVINTYCFIQTTFTVLRHHNVTVSVAHPGVGPDLPGEGVRRHAYYQWVPFVLFGQAISFYACHHVWKYLEKGRVAAVSQGVKNSWLASNKETGDLKEFADNILTWFKMNRDWGRWFVTLEVLCWLNLLLQMSLTDALLAGDFFSLGPRWLETRDPDSLLDLVFPKVTKCTFRKYGASGTLQTHDAICVVALNIIHEKIFIILWFWWIGLLIMSLVGFLWRLITAVLHSRSSAFNRLIWGEISPGPVINLQDADTITSRISFFDWLFLYYLGKNMDPDLFRLLVSQLAKGIRREPGTPPLDHPKAKLLSLDSPDSGYTPDESYC